MIYCEIILSDEVFMDFKGRAAALEGKNLFAGDQEVP